MSTIEHKVTAVIINYRTPDLTQRAIESFRAHYPNIPVILIDNGSRDKSIDILQQYQTRDSRLTQLIFNNRNLYHGPAMHQAIHRASTDYVFFLESDCEVSTGGFIEEMLDIAERDDRCYAVGKLVYMNNRGFDIRKSEGAIPYVRPVSMLLRRAMYFALPPFSHHGTPCLENMREAVVVGYHLVGFPVFDYITHKGRGTASRYGYGLGLRGKLNYLLNRIGL